MQRTSFKDMRCPIAQTLEVIGDWWTPLILRDIAFGVTRFDAIQRDLGISRKVLTERLTKLVEHEVVQRVPYTETPTRYDYVLTEKGLDLGQVLLAMKAWGDRWTLGGEGETWEIRHEPCGAVTPITQRCTGCGEPLRLPELSRVTVG